jgi:hypothetical protein
MIRWVYAFIDRPVDWFEPAAEFWTAVTGTTLSPRRGENLQFATFLPPDGDAFLKVQAVGGAGGMHIDLSVEDPVALAARAVDLGASVVADHGTYAILASPAGQLFCAVRWHGEARRPAPAIAPDGAMSQPDQVAVDVSEPAFGAEVMFWSSLTGWPAREVEEPEFRVLQSPSPLPVRILVQELDEPRPASAHLDLACSDVPAVRAWHLANGAEVVDVRPEWTVMRDPAGGVYCLTRRRP